MATRRRGRLGVGATISALAHAVVLGAILWHPVLHLPPPPERLATVAILMTHGGGDQRAVGNAARPAPMPVPPAPPKPPTPKPAPATAPAPPPLEKQQVTPAPRAVVKAPPPRPRPTPMEFGALGGPSFTIQQDASHSLEVSSKPDKGNLAPIYPPEAARRHEMGTVALVLHIAPDGFVDRVDIVQSSGYPLLDQAAVSRLRTWHFTPATRGGMPVSSIYKIAVTFGP